MEHVDPEHPASERTKSRRESAGRPAVFISYAWEADEEQELHRRWVADIAGQIRDSGADVLLDQWDVKPGGSLTRFMEQSIERADVVVVICTRIYAARIRESRGGVGYEQRMIGARLLSTRRPLRVIPVLREGTGHDAIPTFLSGLLYVDARGDANQVEIEKLIRTIHEPERATAGALPISSPPPVRNPRWHIAAAIVVFVAVLAVVTQRIRTLQAVPPTETSTPALVEEAIVRGTVFDLATGNGVAEVELSAAGMSGVLATTDHSGAFVLVLPHRRSFMLHIRKTGYAPASRAVDAPPLYPVEIGLSQEESRP